MPRGRPKKSQKTDSPKKPQKKKKIKNKKAPNFEESIDQINTEIIKRRSKWNLTVLAWMDFEDVAQILRIHIYKKWDLYDSSQPLGPWINRIISNQIKNLIRNNYGNYARPCLRCAASEADNSCSIYGSQDSVCPLYSHWEKTKKSAHDAKLPVSLEDHPQEVFSKNSDNTDVERLAEQLHKKMEKVLKPIEWKVYRLLYIEHKSDEEAAKLMGYRTSEKNRIPGYKQIKNIKKSIIEKVRRVLEKGEIDYI